MSLEQEFTHRRVLDEAQKLNRDQLLSVVNELHMHYLVRGGILSRLISWCQQEGYPLPDASEVLEPR